MAGHSKWNNIKNKKGKEDARRAKNFTKLARAIIVAVREGGSEPDYNSNLKIAIEHAKMENMPNDNIERAIKKGMGSMDSDNYEEVIYEGYGSGGIAVIVKCLTDNRNRTAADVRHAFDKYGGNLGQTGSVSFMFDYKGIIVCSKDDSEEESDMMEILDFGASDIRKIDDLYEVETDLENFLAVNDKLSGAGYKISESNLSYIPQNYIKLTKDEDVKNIVKMFDLLEESDDVQSFYHNWDIPEEFNRED